MWTTASTKRLTSLFLLMSVEVAFLGVWIPCMDHLVLSMGVRMDLLVVNMGGVIYGFVECLSWYRWHGRRFFWSSSCGGHSLGAGSFPQPYVVFGGQAV